MALDKWARATSRTGPSVKGSYSYDRQYAEARSHQANAATMSARQGGDRRSHEEASSLHTKAASAWNIAGDHDRADFHSKKANEHMRASLDGPKHVEAVTKAIEADKRGWPRERLEANKSAVEALRSAAKQAATTSEAGKHNRAAREHDLRAEAARHEIEYNRLKAVGHPGAKDAAQRSVDASRAAGDHANADRVSRDAGFDDDAHPRDEHGRFASK